MKSDETAQMPVQWCHNKDKKTKVLHLMPNLQEGINNFEFSGAGDLKKLNVKCLLTEQHSRSQDL